jgi:pyroglutamyl-peptidase
MRLLLTGFEPFDGSPLNPSQQVVARLEAEGLPGIELATAILPVDRLLGPEKLLLAVDTVQPQAVLCLGEASTRAVLSIERLAVNLLNFTIPDNQGVKVEDEPVVPGRPAAYFATLPVRKAFQAVRAAQVPVEISLSAGSYLCNQVFYTLLNYLSRRGMDIPAGFVHLPRLPEQVADLRAPGPSMNLDTSLRGIQAVLRLLQEVVAESSSPDVGYTKHPAAIASEAKQSQPSNQLKTSGMENIPPETLSETFTSQVLIRRATLEDIDAQVEMRLALQREIGALYADAPSEGAAEANRQYLRWALPAEEFLAWVAEAGGQLVACSGLVLYSRMPGMHGLASHEAYVMNIYTHPAYRRQGIASELLNRMIQFARHASARRIWLRATPLGEPVYEKIGFEPMESAMQLKLE